MEVINFNVDAVIDRANKAYAKLVEKGEKGKSYVIYDMNSQAETRVCVEQKKFYVLLYNRSGIIYVYQYYSKTRRLRTVPCELWPKGVKKENRRYL